MIFEKQTNANILQEGEANETLKMSLDLDSAQILMQMLSKNLYSDAIGSTIRECASNALDSHRRAGTDKPIIVSFKINNQSDSYEFAVEDFGIGLDADDVKNIISKYGKSTKRNSDTELGMMGLGFKSPLAYSSSFYFVARKNGMERKYMMYEGEDVNSIDLLYEKETDQPNGVKIIVPVKYGERYSFINKIKEQLCYFEGVYLDVPGFSEMSNNFTILRHELYQHSSMCQDHRMHICLDNVYYPLDFNKLGINTIDLGIGLRFSLTDGLFPTPNRESLIYTKEAKEIILKRIVELADHIVNKYNENASTDAPFKQVMDFYRESNRTLVDFPIKGQNYDFRDMINYSSVQLVTPKLKDIDVDYKRMFRDLNEYVMGEYVAGYRLENGRFMDAKNYWDKFRLTDLYGWRGRDKLTKVYVYEDRIGGVMKDYLRQTTPNNADTIYFLRKKKPFELGDEQQIDYSTYHSLLGLRNDTIEEQEYKIGEFRKFIAVVEEFFTDINTINIPQTWLDARKSKKQIVTASTTHRVNGTVKVTAKGEFCGKVGTRTENWLNDQYCKFAANTFKLEDLYKSNKIHVYSTEVNKKKMDELWSIFSNHVNFVIVAESTFKNIQKLELHNWITMEQFLEGKNRPFRTIATYLLVAKLVSTYNHTFKKTEILDKISSDLAGKLKTLADFDRANFMRRMDVKTQEAIMELAAEHKLYDPEMYSLYKEIKATLEKLPFIETMMQNAYIGNESFINAICDLFKYYNQKVNLNRYNKVKLNEDAPLDEALTESTVEELQNI